MTCLGGVLVWSVLASCEHHPRLLSPLACRPPVQGLEEGPALLIQQPGVLGQAGGHRDLCTCIGEEGARLDASPHEKKKRDYTSNESAASIQFRKRRGAQATATPLLAIEGPRGVQ